MRTLFRVISVQGSPRRGSFQLPPDELGLDCRFFDASTGLADGLGFDPKLNYRYLSRRLVPAEIGCFSSHVRTWRALLAEPSATQMIVLEDDVFVDWPFFAAVARIDWSARGAHYLKFYTKYPARHRVVKWCFPFEDRHLVEYTSLALGTGAYLVTRWAAERFEQRVRAVTLPIDIAMDRPWATGVPVLGLVPSAAMELSVPSSMRDRQKSDVTRLQRYDYLWRRVIERTRARAYPWLHRTVRLRDLGAGAEKTW